MRPIIAALIILALCMAVFIAPALAQNPPAGVVPDGFWPEFLSAAKAAGWFGTLVMGLLWWLERGERKEMQCLLMGEKGNGGLLERFMTAFHDVKDAIKDLRSAFPKGPQ